MAQTSQVRTYHPAESAVFLKTNERFGGLSNMAPGFPIFLNGVRIRTSEALYQACRFPRRPDVQRQIIDDPSPMTAKMRSKPFRSDTRPDWDAVRVKIMRWCLRVKLAQNWQTFGKLLLSTGEMPIVEKKVRRKDFWGATEQPDGTLVGMNVLGRLLMELREQLKGDEAESLRFIEPLAIPDFLLFGEPIEAVQAPNNAQIPGWAARRSPAPVAAPPPSDPQPSLFEQPMIAEAQTSETQAPSTPIEAGAEPSRYPTYRPARVHWLGEIPAHWPEKRGKYFFREVDERSQTGEEELLSVSHTTGVTPRSQKNVTMFKAESYVGHKLARPNDVVINTMWAWMSALGVSKDVGIVSPAYGVYRPLNDGDFLPAYLDYLLRTPMLRWEYICRSTGIRSSRLRLYPDKFLDIAFPCPPREEQERMVAFLRGKDVQVRRLIRSKRRLIGLLNEQKQAIINRAVTRGLNPDAPMKPTGIDWMPEVPAHWEVRRLKTVCRFIYGDALADQNRRPGEFKVFGSNGPVGLHDEANTAGPCLLIGRKGSFGKINFSEDPVFAIDTVFYVDRRSTGHNLRWLYYLLQCLKLDSVSKDAAVPGLDREDAHNNRVPLCCHEEQQQIATFLDSELAELNSVIARVQTEINLINEYRERLIADVVTGKVDVRHIEIAAPADEPLADEDDALDEDDTLDEALEDGEADVMEGADADD